MTRRAACNSAPGEQFAPYSIDADWRQRGRRHRAARRLTRMLAATSLALAMLLLSTAGEANGQARLDSMIAIGQTVVVVDTTKQKTQGRVLMVSETSLVLQPRTGPERRFDIAEIAAVRKPDPITQGLLIGAGVGLGLGLGDYYRDVSEGSAEALLFYAGLGSLIGTGIDGLIPTKTLYRGPASQEQEPKRPRTEVFANIGAGNWNDDSTPSSVKTADLNVGVSIRPFRDHLQGFAFQFDALCPKQLGGCSKATLYSANTMFNFAGTARAEPYILLGGGVWRSSQAYRENSWAVNLGFGSKIFIHHRVSLRPEARFAVGGVFLSRFAMGAGYHW